MAPLAMSRMNIGSRMTSSPIETSERGWADGSSLYPSRCSRTAASASDKPDVDGVVSDAGIVGPE
jgi:hypothetical protein